MIWGCSYLLADMFQECGIELRVLVAEIDSSTLCFGHEKEHDDLDGRSREIV
jgi:hypothetical protein